MSLTLAIIILLRKGEVELATIPSVDRPRPPHALRMDRPRHHTLCAPAKATTRSVDGPATPPHTLRTGHATTRSADGPATPPRSLRTGHATTLSADRPRHHALCGPATPLWTGHATTFCVDQPGSLWRFIERTKDKSATFSQSSCSVVFTTSYPAHSWMYKPAQLPSPSLPPLFLLDNFSILPCHPCSFLQHITPFTPHRGDDDDDEEEEED